MREATQRDRERYLTSGLVSVDCRFCHVAVQVKKLGPGHTSVQWNTEASQRCAYFTEIRQSGGESARARSCPKLADSIKHAVAEGCLEEVSQRPFTGRRLVFCSASLSEAARTIADRPQPRPQQPVAPITALQVGDLLSPKVQNKDGNLFITVEPQECSGMAREVDPPLIFDLHPAATDGGHWVDGGEVIDEAAGVYHADFDAKHALAEAKRTIESCRDVPFTVTDMRGRQYHFRLLPQVNSGSPDIVLWSFTGRRLGLRRRVRCCAQCGRQDLDVCRRQWIRRAVAGSRRAETD